MKRLTGSNVNKFFSKQIYLLPIFFPFPIPSWRFWWRVLRRRTFRWWPCPWWCKGDGEGIRLESARPRWRSPSYRRPLQEKSSNGRRKNFLVKKMVKIIFRVIIFFFFFFFPSLSSHNAPCRILGIFLFNLLIFFQLVKNYKMRGKINYKHGWKLVLIPSDIFFEWSLYDQFDKKG